LPQLSRYVRGPEFKRVTGMTYESEMADNYRSRARQLRALADIDREAQTSAMLRAVAESYDTMAASLEGIDSRKPENAQRVNR
jgi:hypothetical protein